MNWLKNLLGVGETAERKDSEATATSIPGEVLPHERAGWDPTVEERPGELTGSKLGGLAALLPDEEWPTCGNCRRPMQLFVQLNSTELPEGAGLPFGDGILQLFYCTSIEPHCESDEEAWSPFGKSTLARILPLGIQAQLLDRSPVEGPFPERTIVGWRQLRDFPNWEELEELGITLPDQEADDLSEQGFPRKGDKLRGWPDWVQGLEYPSCPDCKTRMEFLFQVDSEDNLPYMFGDVGCGHLFICKSHSTRLGFGWACS